ADGGPGGISGVMEYASDLFERASVEALAARLVRLLEAAGAGPGGAVGRLDILSAWGRRARLGGWDAPGWGLAGGARAARVGAAAVCGAGGRDAGRGCGRVWG